MARKKAKGLGDTVEAIFEATGIKKAVETVADALNIEDCGCGKRKDFLNNLVPYKQEDPDGNYIEIDGQRVRVFE